MSLFNLAFARQQGGSFVLRIEDTDRARFRADSEQQVFDTLHWLGLTWDEGPDVGGPYAPYRQSERLDTYRPYVERLVAEGKAYHCWCSPQRLAEMRDKQQKLKLPTGYDRLCHGKTREERALLPGFNETPVVRMLVPEDVELQFDDLIRGRVSAPMPDDQVILKGDGFPTYHLAVVVDDHEMGITHVVRGEEWISSDPKHILLYRWLGLEAPQFAHMPLLRNTDKSKISKRKNPAARLTWFQEQGYLPEALVNFLALLAYPPKQDAEGNDVEVFTFEEFAKDFDWRKVNPVGPIFDLKKLEWLNGVYIRELEVGELATRLLPYLEREGILSDSPSLGELARLKAVTELIQTRMALLTEAAALVRPFYLADDELEIADDARAQLKENAGEVLGTGDPGARRHRRPPHRGAGDGQRLERRRHRGGLCARPSSTDWASSRSSRSVRCARPSPASASRRRCSSRWRSSARRPPWRVCTGSTTSWPSAESPIWEGVREAGSIGPRFTA